MAIRINYRYYITIYYIYLLEFCFKHGICFDAVRNSLTKLIISVTLTSVTQQVSMSMNLCKMEIQCLSYFVVVSMQVCYYISVAIIHFHAQCSIGKFCSEMGDYRLAQKIHPFFDGI